MRRVNILGVEISAVNKETAIQYLLKNMDKARGRYICACNVHTTVTAHENLDYQAVQNNSFMTLPDGKPLSSVGIRRGYSEMGRVTGPDFMEQVIAATEKSDARHYFYGTTQENLNALLEYLKVNYPQLSIVGCEPSLFRPLTMCADRIYPQFKPKGQIATEEKKAINNRIKDLFTSKIGGIIYDSADTIVISSFLGLTALAIYQNYFYILNAITGLITVVFSACTAGIGNSIVVETKEKNYKDLNKFTFIICWGAGFCAVCLLCLYQPFMELWVGKDLMLSSSAVICFVVYFFVRQLNSLFNTYKDASGMWHEDRFRPLVAALTNLALNLILVQFIGLYGILISTVLAIVCVGMPWLLHNLFTVIFEKKYLVGYLKNLLYYCFIILINCTITYFICTKVNAGLITTLVIRGAICVVLPNLIYLFAYYKRIEFTDSLLLVNKMTKGKLRSVLTKLGMRE